MSKALKVDKAGARANVAALKKHALGMEQQISKIGAMEYAKNQSETQNQVQVCKEEMKSTTQSIKLLFIKYAEMMEKVINDYEALDQKLSEQFSK